MKVKKLEWKSSESGLYIKSFDNKFCVTLPVLKDNKNYFLAEERFILKGDAILGKFNTLEEAKHACQEHYEKFILSQIF